MQQTNQITKLTIADPEQFVRFFKFYDKCNDNTEITLNFEKDKLFFREMNQANTLLTEITLKDSLFVEFYAEKGKKDISMPELLSFLKRANKEDLMQLEFNDTKYNVILKSSITRTFTGNILALEKTEQKQPNLKHSAKVTIDSKKLTSILKEFKKEFLLQFVIINNKLIVNIYNSDSNLVRKNEIEDCSVSGDNTISTFGFETLKNAITDKLSGNLTLNLGKDYPILIEYAANNYQVNVVVAPDDHIKDYVETTIPKINEPKKEIKHSGKYPEIQWEKKQPKPKQKRGKLDLEDIGFNENFKCPNCKEMISFYYFIDKFATHIGSVKEVLEQDFNADPDFAGFVLENDKFHDEMDEYINDFLRKRLKEMYKKFKRGG